MEWSSCRLKKASLGDVVLRDCLWLGTNFDGSGWLRVEVAGGIHSGMVLTDCSLEDVVFEKAKLNLVNFRASKLKRVIFRSCDLTGADFQGAILDNVQFQDCDLREAEFSNCKLKRVDLRTSDISAINGVGSLRGATITTAQLVSIAGALARESGLVIED